MSFIYQSILFLIRLAKVLPFIVCSLVAVSYIETICSFSFSNFVVWSNYTIPYKPISWAIAGIAEYGLQWSKGARLERAIEQLFNIELIKL